MAIAMIDLVRIRHLWNPSWSDSGLRSVEAAVGCGGTVAVRGKCCPGVAAERDEFYLERGVSSVIIVFSAGPVAHLENNISI